MFKRTRNKITNDGCKKASPDPERKSTSTGSFIRRILNLGSCTMGGGTVEERTKHKNYERLLGDEYDHDNYEGNGDVNDKTKLISGQEKSIVATKHKTEGSNVRFDQRKFSTKSYNRQYSRLSDGVQALPGSTNKEELVNDQESMSATTIAAKTTISTANTANFAATSIATITGGTSSNATGSITEQSTSDDVSDDNADGNDDTNTVLSRTRVHWRSVMDFKFRDIDALLTSIDLPEVPMNSIFSGVNDIVLGTGASGSVTLKKYCTPKGVKKVAVKTINVKSTQVKPMECHNQEYCLKRAEIEARMLRKLSKAYDVFPKVYGVITETPDELSIIMEFIGKATISHLLQYERQSSYCNKLQWFYIIKDVTMGIKHIHDIDILHNDIAMRNVVLKSNGQRICAKIVDLGNVATVSSKQARNYKDRFASEDLRRKLLEKWPEIAPDFFTGSGVETKETDIYALGVLFQQIGTQKKMVELMNLGHLMTNRIPRLRPTALHVLNAIQKCINNETQEGDVVN